MSSGPPLWVVRSLPLVVPAEETGLRPASSLRVRGSAVVRGGPDCVDCGRGAVGPSADVALPVPVLEPDDATVSGPGLVPALVVADSGRGDAVVTAVPRPGPPVLVSDGDGGEDLLGSPANNVVDKLDAAALELAVVIPSTNLGAVVASDFRSPMVLPASVASCDPPTGSEGVGV